MLPPEQLPQTDTLKPADVRWLQSEFRATREAQSAAADALNQRLDDHIAAGHPEGRARRRKRPDGDHTVRDRTVRAALAVAAAIATIVGSFYSSGGGSAATR